MKKLWDRITGKAEKAAFIEGMTAGFMDSAGICRNMATLWAQGGPDNLAVKAAKDCALFIDKARRSVTGFND